MSRAETGDGQRAARLDEVEAALHAAWRERVGGDDGPGEEALALVDADAGAAGELVAAVLAPVRADGAHGPGVTGSSGEASEPAGAEAVARRVAESVGRRAGHEGTDLETLQGVFCELRDALFATLVESRHEDTTALPRRGVERCARDAARAVRPASVAAGEAWFDERGRAFRHDIKTPLQAASLNLELLALESAEKGLDAEALDVIQRSLDQAVELVQGLEPRGGPSGGRH